MSSYNPSSTFLSAASYLSSASSLSNISTATKLELYGLFKYLTVSPAPDISRPSLFSMTERAKWDAWSAASKTHEDRKEAEKRYLEIARGLGWTLGVAAVPTSVDQSRKQSDETTKFSDDIWDFETNGSESNSGDGGNGGVGMATSVSAMAPPPLDEQDAKSLHGLAVANNVLGLSSYLDACPGININNLDEHGYTALHLACDRGNAAAVELLLRRGADWNLKDPDDFTALELANVAGHDNIVALVTLSSRQGSIMSD